jgi:hypothetical protein
MLHLFIIPHVQTQSNRVCNSYFILLWLMLPRDHFVSRILYSICRVIALDLVKICIFQIVLHVAQNYLTKGHKTLQECCTTCDDVHLLFQLCSIALFCLLFYFILYLSILFCFVKVMALDLLRIYNFQLV